jgi:hypothetical protein
VYEFEQDGDALRILAGAADLGPQAAWELGHGDVLFSHGIVLNRTGDVPVLEGRGQSVRYINATSIPAPGAAAIISVVGLVGLQCRRR